MSDTVNKDNYDPLQTPQTFKYVNSDKTKYSWTTEKPVSGKRDGENIICNIPRPTKYVIRNYQNIGITPLEVFELFFSENIIMQITIKQITKLVHFWKNTMK